MDTHPLDSHFPHVFHLRVNQRTPGYGNPAGLADHLKPRYAKSPPAHALKLFEVVHMHAMRGTLKARDIAAIRRCLRTAGPAFAAETMPLAALALITAEDVRECQAKGMHEADMIVTQVLKLLRHHLGVQSATFAEKAAEFFLRLAQGKRFNFDPPSDDDALLLQQTLMNALIGLSFQACHLDQASIDRHIDAFHEVLIRHHSSEKPGLGRRIDMQARIIEAMLVVGVDAKMARCKHHAISWIRWWRFRDLTPDTGFNLARTCVRHLLHYSNDGLPYDFSNMDKDFLRMLTNDQRNALREEIEAVLCHETNPIITRPMHVLINLIVSLNTRIALTPKKSS